MIRTAASPTAFDGTSDHAVKDAKTLVAWLRGVTSAPFVHFTALGALVFAGHGVMTRTLDVRTLEVSVSKQQELATLFTQRQRRAPTATEREQLIRRYVEDEVLFREGLRLSLVHTDPLLRAQIIARVRGMLQAELDQKPPTEIELRRYYEAHLSSYAGPEATGHHEFASVREQVDADYRKDRTSRAFQSEVTRLTSEWRIEIAERP